MKGEGETFRLLQPGLMSVEELSEIMTKRGISCKNNKNKPKNDLVEQYEKHLLPLSRRKFPNSHRGQILNKKIVEEDKKRTRNEPKERDLQYGFTEKPSLKRPISSESSRLKPPIDSACSSPKKICLSRKPSSDLDNVVINDRSKRNSESSSDESKKGHSHKADKLSPVKSPSSKKEAKESEKDEPNPKRKKIAWP